MWHHNVTNARTCQFSAVCLAVFPFEFRPRTFTIGFCGKTLSYRRTKSNVSVLKEIGWPTLAWRRRRYKLLLFWNLLNRQGPPSLQSKLPPLASERATQTLRKNTFRQAVCKTSRRLRSFLPSCIALWNSLPVSCTSCSSPHTFLASLDKHFSADMYSFGL